MGSLSVKIITDLLALKIADFDPDIDSSSYQRVTRTTMILLFITCFYEINNETYHYAIITDNQRLSTWSAFTDVPLFIIRLIPILSIVSLITIQCLSQWSLYTIALK